MLGYPRDTRRRRSVGAARTRAAVTAVAASVFVFLTAAMPSQAVTLVADGQPRATIVLDANPLDTTRRAVTELVRYVEEISGAELPVVESGEPVSTPVRILVGLDHPNLAERFPGVDLNLTGFNEFVLADHGDDVLIAGRDGKQSAADLQAGTALGIYTFIEEQLGVRWLWPGDLGTDVPHQPTITLDAVDKRFTPPLQQRYLRLLAYTKGSKDYRGKLNDLDHLNDLLDDPSRDWRRRQRMDFKWVGVGHAFTQWWDKYHEEHPEYFALQPNGTREPYPRPDRVKLDISEPGVTRQWLEGALEQLKNRDWQQVVTAAPNDSEYQGYCVCPECEAMDAESGPTIRLRWEGRKAEHVALTDRYARWWNQLARQLKAHLPADRTAYVGTWAYGAYRTPPQEVQLEDNVIVGYIGGLPAYPLDRREEERRNWEQWSQNASHLLWRPNFFYFDRGTPIVFAQRAAEDFRWLTEHRMIGIDMDVIYGHWALQGLQYYVMAKLAWDPYVDLDAVLNDYMVRAFGPDAAPMMREYFAQLEDAYYRQIDAQKNMSGLERISSLPKIRPPHFLDRLESLLDDAESAVEPGPEAQKFRDRLAFVRVGLDFTRLQMQAISAMTALREAKGNKTNLRQAAEAAAARRDAFLDEQAESFTLNTVWAMHNWSSNDTVQSYFGPPAN